MFCVFNVKQPHFCFICKTPPNKEVIRIDSPISWLGGKKSLREKIIIRFPLNYKRYIEVFGGGAWVLFFKPPEAFEVYNDFNCLLTNLFRCMRDCPDELNNEMEFMLNSRLDFEYVKEILNKTPEKLPDPKRAAYFYFLVRCSYGSGASDFACQPRAVQNYIPAIKAASIRLQKVIVENRDFERLIKQYDRPESFFYCDPPYYMTEDYYMGDGFSRKDHQRLADVLCNIQGKFLLSYNDCEEIRELYNRPGILVERTTRISNLAQRYEGGKEYPELFISNYDTREFQNSCVQMSLFKNLTEEMLGEREIIYERLNEINSGTD